MASNNHHQGIIMDYRTFSPQTVTSNNNEASYWRYWGKARPTNEHGAQYHLLPYHCLDVAAVASEWWDNSSAICHAFKKSTGLNDEKTKAWLLFFIALHDYGKFDIRFQLKAPQAWQKVNPVLSQLSVHLNDQSIKTYNHGPAGLYWFYQDLRQRFEGDDDFFQDDTSEWKSWYSWLAPVTGHHGIVPQDHQKENHEYSIPAHLVSGELFDEIRQNRLAWLSTLNELFLLPAGLSVDKSPPNICNAATMLAGFCSVADWLGSCAEPGKFSYDNRPVTDLNNWFGNRLSIAKLMLKDAGIISCIKKPCQGVGVLLDGKEPRQIQCLVNEMPVSNGLTLVESSTGSGKTEAALAYAWRLLADGLADSIIFALPTQATANAMLERLEKAAVIMFKGDSNIVLAHGRSKYQQEFIDLKKACRPQTAQNEEEAWVQCGQWLAQSRKRVFLGQVGVCTIDQVLVSVLPLRHKFVRGFGIGRSVLIVDEVHAYDTYMYGLLEEVLRQQRLAGGSAILLSATLPHYQKKQLGRAWGVDIDVANTSYPLITHCHGSEVQFYDLEKIPEQKPESFEVTVDLQFRENLLPDDALLDAIIHAASLNAQICLICNLVDVAQTAFDRLLEKISLKGLQKDQIQLFHSRFVFSDRQNKEKSVRDTFGSKSERKKGNILVATQVAEQSLDLDFDWLITQLCPVDLLFQRIGRLHRHIRSRPEGFEKPRCTVLLPAEENYGLHTLIYGNSRVLWRTQYYLQQSDGKVEFPAAYRDWIEPVYKQDDWSNEPRWVKDDYLKFEDKLLTLRSNARLLVNSSMNPLADSDSHVAVLTRDGEMNLTVVPTFINSNDKNCLLDGTPLNRLDDSNRQEAINLNSLGVPASWNRKKGRLPEIDDTTGMIWLPMQSQDCDVFNASYGDCHYVYRHDQGLRRIFHGDGQ